MRDPRKVSLGPNPTAEPASRIAPPRVGLLDLNDFMYGRRRCEPAIAGSLVRKDIGHLTRVFARRRHTTSGSWNGHDRLVAAAVWSSRSDA